MLPPLVFLYSLHDPKFKGSNLAAGPSEFMKKNKTFGPLRFRLRYDSPVNASPSRIADHVHPWDDDPVGDGTISRRSFTPFMPANPGRRQQPGKPY